MKNNLLKYKRCKKETERILELTNEDEFSESIWKIPPHLVTRTKFKFELYNPSSILKNMLQKVEDADVVIWDGWRYAVVLRYLPEIDIAPYVVAKGIGETLRKILKTAYSNGIMIHFNLELAREIYLSVKVGELIPYEMYNRVGKIYDMINT